MNSYARCLVAIFITVVPARVIAQDADRPSEAQQRAVGEAASPAANASLKARIVDVSGAEDFPAIFKVLDRSRFIFTARDLTSAQIRSGELWRPLRMGEPLLPYYLLGDEVMAQTLDGQTITVDKSMVLLSPHSAGVVFPSAKELDVNVVVDGEAPVRVRPESPTSSGLKLSKLPDGLSQLADGSSGRDAFLASQAAFVSCYDAAMKAVDPDGKRFRFVQATVNKKSGQAVKMESLETVFDRQVCKKCNCLAYSTKRSSFIADLLAPLQKAKFEKLSPVMDRTRALFASK